jgi:glycosyltransferase involved in cell wall biosynthesis
MRFLFVAPSAYLLGGVQDWLYTLTLELRKKGHLVKVAIPNDCFHNGVIYNRYYKDIDAIFFSNRTNSYQGRLNALSKLLIDCPVDVIVGVNIGDLYEACKRTMDKIRHTKIVMSFHAFEIEYLRDIGKYSKLLDGVITTNKLSQQIVIKLGLISENRVLYAPYGVYTDSLIGERKLDNDLKIAWVGRMENQQKRIKDLVCIVKYLDASDITYRLSIAGDGPFRSEIEEQLGMQVREKKVRFLGCLNKTTLKTFYHDNDILLITSEWETGPIVAWEAMLSGLAIVSSSYIGSRLEGALINEETALLFPVGGNEVAAKQIARLRENELRERLSYNGMQMARSRYSMDRSVSSWEDAFHSIASLDTRIKDDVFREQLVRKSGRLDSLLGTRTAELCRKCLVRKGSCRDPGCEWPHSLSSKSTSKKLLDYAQTLEWNENA